MLSAVKPAVSHNPFSTPRSVAQINVLMFGCKQHCFRQGKQFIKFPSG